jgi:hypothetical protein
MPTSIWCRFCKSLQLLHDFTTNTISINNVYLIGIIHSKVKFLAIFCCLIMQSSRPASIVVSSYYIIAMTWQSCEMIRCWWKNLNLEYTADVGQSLQSISWYNDGYHLIFCCHRTLTFIIIIITDGMVWNALHFDIFVSCWDRKMTWGLKCVFCVFCEPDRPGPKYGQAHRPLFGLEKQFF